jgi:hypothetical protein
MIGIDTNILAYARIGISPMHGVTEFATANTKDFEGLGFRRV